MTYVLDFSKQALKEFEKINEPFYSGIKQAISDLTLNPRPQGYKKLNGRNGYRIRQETTASSMISLIINSLLKLSP